MTDPTGRSFISYRRTRCDEIKHFVEAQHDIGIPTWQDLDDLETGHTDERLREALAASDTANAVCWLTPDVAESPVITRTELPGILQRIDQRDEFFMVPVAAGGLDYKDVAKVVGDYIGTHQIDQWNVEKTTADPASEADAARLARYVLKHRIERICSNSRKGEALRLSLHTRTQPAPGSGAAFSLDWTHRFNGRLALPGAWGQYLLPALETVARMCERQAAARPVIADGLCALPAAVALGSTFLSTRRLSLTWRQSTPGRTPQDWSLDATPEPSGFEPELRSGNPRADDLALLVSVNSDVRHAFGASKSSLPAFRGIVLIAKEGDCPHDVASPGEAADIVRVIREALRKARAEWQPRGQLHLFLAVPAGLAVMIGQSLNTFGPVQTYEHMATDSVGKYEPAVLLDPSQATTTLRTSTSP